MEYKCVYLPGLQINVDDYVPGTHSDCKRRKDENYNKQIRMKSVKSTTTLKIKKSFNSKLDKHAV